MQTKIAERLEYWYPRSCAFLAPAVSVHGVHSVGIGTIGMMLLNVGEVAHVDPPGISLCC